MTGDTLLGLVFSIAVLALGVIVLVLAHAPRSEKMEAVLNVPHTLRSLVAILIPRAGQIRVVDATEMSYTLRLPCRTGWFWHAGTPRKGTLFFAPVPLGFVAKLPGEDSVAGRRFTDTSSLCLVTELAGSEVGGDLAGSGHTSIEVLQRCRRWQILIHGGEGQEIKTRHDILVRAHVAVQTSIEVDATDPAISIVFSDHRNYIRAVESHVVRTLRRLASQREYSELVTTSGDVTEELNAGWAKLIAGKDEQPPTPSCTLVKTFFSGVVLKLYAEQEEARLQRALASRVSSVEREFKDLELELSTWSANLQARLADPMGRLDDVINMFTGLGTLTGQSPSGDLEFANEPGGGFQSRLKEHLKSNARSMQNQRDPSEFHRAAKELIPRVQKDLKQQCDDILLYAEQFRDAIGFLKQEELKCEQEAPTSPDAEAKQ
jgi:hypothetical protein